MCYYFNCLVLSSKSSALSLLSLKNEKKKSNTMFSINEFSLLSPSHTNCATLITFTMAFLTESASHFFFMAVCNTLSARRLNVEVL